MKCRSRSKRKAVAFRLTALLLGILPFLIGELIVRVCGWREPIANEDPFVGFSEIRPLFVLNSDHDRFEVSASRRAFFQSDSFPAKKTENEFRIFCLGGSTVQGRPYGIETSFARLLEIDLQAAEPSRPWDVVNCGGVSYASYRLVPIMREVLGHDPDLIILCTGHNEFLEARSYGHLKRLPTFVEHSWHVASRSRLFQWTRYKWQQWTFDKGAATIDERTELAAEVDALLDYNGALADYHRDDPARDTTIEHFRYNLARMIRIAADAGVPLILVNPISNLKDCPPFKSENRSDLSPEEKRNFEQIWEQAKQDDELNMQQRILLIRQAIAIDDRHAGVHFHLGKCLEASGEHRLAAESFLRAKEEDVCPLRIIEPMHRAILDAADESNLPLVKVDDLFKAEYPGRAIGDEMLVDHVHPSLHGHQLIAEALLLKMVSLGQLKPIGNWRELRKKRFVEHYNSLDLVYFDQGRRRLEGLKRWTKGRSRLIRKRPKRTQTQ